MVTMESSATRTTQNYRSWNEMLSKQQVVCTHELGHDLRSRQSGNVQIPLMDFFGITLPSQLKYTKLLQKGSFNEWIYTAIWIPAEGHRNGRLPPQLVFFSFLLWCINCVVSCKSRKLFWNQALRSLRTRLRSVLYTPKYYQQARRSKLTVTKSECGRNHKQLIIFLTVMKSKNLEQNPRVREYGIMVPDGCLKDLEQKKSRCTDWISWVQEIEKTQNSEFEGCKRDSVPNDCPARVGVSSLRTRCFILVASRHPVSSHLTFFM